MWTQPSPSVTVLVRVDHTSHQSPPNHKQIPYDAVHNDAATRSRLEFALPFTDLTSASNSRFVPNDATRTASCGSFSIILIEIPTSVRSYARRRLVGGI